MIRHPKGKTGFLVVLMTALLLVLMGTGANAITLYHFVGTVSDAAGRPLAGVTVSDGSQSTFTGSNGTYSLPESSTGTFTLRASRSDTNQVSKTVTVTLPLDTTANFSLLYLITGTVSPPFFNNSVPTTLSLQASSTAPSGSCTTASVSPMNDVVPLSLSGTAPNGTSTWTGSDSVPSGLGDGAFNVTFSAAECASGTVLTTVSTATYILDTLAPELSMLAPLDQGNTLYPSQLIVAQADDFLGGSVTPGGSGVDPASISIVVTDDAHQEADRHPTVQLSGNIIRSAALSLTPGSKYTATLTASDKAGNQATGSADFQVMQNASTTPAGQITATIASLAPSSVQKGGALATTDTYTWTNVPATISSFNVSLNPTLHAGDGTVVATVPTNNASVTYTVAGVPGLAVHPNQASVPLSVPFSTTDTGNVSVAVPQYSGNLGTLTASVPKGADQNSVRLSLSHALSGTSFPTCLDPTTSTQACSPDPLPVNALRLLAQFDSNVAGGQWNLVSSQGTSTVSDLVLGYGNIPSNGTVAVAVPTSLLAQSRDGHVILTAIKPIDSSNNYLAVASAGPTPEQLKNGGVIDLGAPASVTAPAYSSVADAVAASQCSTCVENGTQEPAPAIGDPGTPPQVPSLTGGSSPAMMAATSNTSTTTPALPGSACGSNNSCGATTLLPTSAAQCYNPSPYVRDCILSSRVIHGIFSFRGWSTKVDGSWSTYSVQVGNVERWSDGWRYKAGPFEASGYTDTENENSQTDTWPKRSDCWGGRPYDGPHCPAQVGSGFWAMYGRNTWVWAKHDTCYYYYPSGPYSCSVYENLDADNYDGGTETGTYAGPVSYYIRPSTIRAGQTGSWAKYAPESKLTFYQGSSVTYGSSASISVNWSEAYSSATFSSSMSVQTLRKTTQFEEFRSKSLGLPWFDTGGWFYRYDGGHSPWKYEYWSCEWSPGWTGGSPCWTNGS